MNDNSDDARQQANAKAVDAATHDAYDKGRREALEEAIGVALSLRVENDTRDQLDEGWNNAIEEMIMKIRALAEPEH